MVTADADVIVHVFVGLQHGVHGRPSNLHPIRDLIAREFAAINTAFATYPRVHYEVTYFETSKNSLWRSLQGTVKCGQRLASDALKALHTWLRATGPPPPKQKQKQQQQQSRAATPHTVSQRVMYFVSLIGHSFGSLLWREVIPRLVSDPVASEYGVRFVSFTSIASPHCGACGLGRVLTTAAIVLGWLFSTTYLDLFHQTNVLRTRLLSPKHLGGLALFKFRTLVANVKNDLFVRFETASLCFPDPTKFTDHSEALTQLVAEERRTCEDPGVALPHRKHPSVVGYFRVGCSGSSSYHSPLPPPQREMMGAYCARQLRRRLVWVVMPVVSGSETPSAHKAVIGNSRFAADMTDAMEAVAQRFVAEAESIVNEVEQTAAVSFFIPNNRTHAVGMAAPSHA